MAAQRRQNPQQTRPVRHIRRQDTQTGSSRKIFDKIGRKNEICPELGVAGGKVFVAN